MKRLYLRLVLWLIEPAIARREAEKGAKDLARLKASLAAAMHEPLPDWFNRVSQGPCERAETGELSRDGVPGRSSLGFPRAPEQG